LAIRIQDEDDLSGTTFEVASVSIEETSFDGTSLEVTSFDKTSFEETSMKSPIAKKVFVKIKFTIPFIFLWFCKFY
jgi:hypothetical protein